VRRVALKARRGAVYALAAIAAAAHSAGAFQASSPTNLLGSAGDSRAFFLPRRGAAPAFTHPAVGAPIIGTGVHAMPPRLVSASVTVAGTATKKERHLHMEPQLSAQ
jgi:hypothetical protein